MFMDPILSWDVLGPPHPYAPVPNDEPHDLVHAYSSKSQLRDVNGSVNVQHPIFNAFYVCRSEVPLSCRNECAFLQGVIIKSVTETDLAIGRRFRDALIDHPLKKGTLVPATEGNLEPAT